MGSCEESKKSARQYWEATLGKGSEDQGSKEGCGRMRWPSRSVIKVGKGNH